MTQLIFNIGLILILLVLGFLLIKRWKKLKEGDEDINKLIEELTADTDEKPFDLGQKHTFDDDLPPVSAVSAKISAMVEDDDLDDRYDLDDSDDDLVDESDLDDDDDDDDDDEPEKREKQEVTARFKLKDMEIASDDLKLHEKAKRKARVIVREIEMYNKEKTEMGLKEGNLYKYLKDEIEAGRKTYNDSVPDHVRANTFYFEESLTTILADGEKSILGMSDI